MKTWAVFVAMAAGCWVWLLPLSKGRGEALLWAVAGLGCAAMAAALGIGGA